MSKIVRTFVEHQGNVFTDFSGFTGNDYLTEEQRLRRELAELGLQLSPTSQSRKPLEGGLKADASRRERL